MPKLKNIFTFFFVLLVMCISVNASYSEITTNALNSDKNSDSSKSTLVGPHSYKNLSIYLIKGEDLLDGMKVITLAEALEQNKVKVYETGAVGQLQIENLSKDEYIFVQAGDIVKGGKQDRTLQNDFLIPPQSGKQPIDSFCVESGRWSPRDGESVNEFSSSTKQLASNELKLAARLHGDQSKVWEEVSKIQEDLNKNVGSDVKAQKSATSLQLSLENQDLKKSSQQYSEALSSLLDTESDIIGFAYAVNGEFMSADRYASPELFKKLWPKLLESAITHAISQLDKDINKAAPTIDKVAKQISEKDVKTIAEQTKDDSTFTTKENNDNYYFGTTIENEKGKAIKLRDNVTAK